MITLTPPLFRVLVRNGCRVVAFLMLFGVSVMASATEEPEWVLVKDLGEVEIRHYGPIVQARTPMPAENGSSSVFRILADYIFGGNAEQQEIAMTTPVERTMAEYANYMAFNMPAGYSINTLPVPSGGAVTLHEVPARTLAVLRFSGWARDAVVQDKRRELLDKLASHGIQPKAPPILAQYNPPWTPPWSRRNEVMVEIPDQK